ncbi:hypothetical protein [Nostoc sp. 'Lobaria pulmonaria (5183) cyanobiont']|nr:hypothetical protein [Nostoc sp. 'Lobaria pulmonaria (5183) cyanobiont']
MPSLRDAMRTAGFAYALFNELQRRRGHRGKKERSHAEDFAGNRFF